ACHQAAAWQRSKAGGKQPLWMSVNLSSRQVAHQDLAAVAADILAETGLDPSLLKLEITESVLMEEAETTVHTLNRLKGLGVAIVSMARGLHVPVVAEGVETEAQVAALRALGCELAQGYFFARPLPPDEVTPLLSGLLPGAAAAAV